MRKIINCLFLVFVFITPFASASEALEPAKAPELQACCEVVGENGNKCSVCCPDGRAAICDRFGPECYCAFGRAPLEDLENGDSEE